MELPRIPAHPRERSREAAASTDGRRWDLRARAARLVSSRCPSSTPPTHSVVAVRDVRRRGRARRLSLGNRWAATSIPTCAGRSQSWPKSCWDSIAGKSPRHRQRAVQCQQTERATPARTSVTPSLNPVKEGQDQWRSLRDPAALLAPPTPRGRRDGDDHRPLVAGHRVHRMDA